MITFDLNQVKHFKNLFPELTPDQLETALLFSLGFRKTDIAMMRSVSYIAVEKMLEVIKKKFEFPSLHNLLSVFQVRLVFFALLKCHSNKSGVMK